MLLIKICMSHIKICDLKYNVPKKISGAFHDRSNYDYHFIIKKFAAKFGK